MSSGVRMLLVVAGSMAALLLGVAVFLYSLILFSACSLASILTVILADRKGAFLDSSGRGVFNKEIVGSGWRNLVLPYSGPRIGVGVVSASVIGGIFYGSDHYPVPISLVWFGVLFVVIAVPCPVAPRSGGRGY